MVVALGSSTLVRSLLSPDNLVPVVMNIIHQIWCHCYFLNSSVKHWPILIILACDIKKKLGANDCCFGTSP